MAATTPRSHATLTGAIAVNSVTASAAPAYCETPAVMNSTGAGMREALTCTGTGAGGGAGCSGGSAGASTTGASVRTVRGSR